jgi:type IV pilus assembly protein PilC
MRFFTQMPLANLIQLCRVLRHSLGAGLTLRQVFRQEADRGPGPVRPVAQRISAFLEQGDSLETALEKEEKTFPPLFLSLAVVGERTGNLPEVFGELEKYYILLQRFWRKFWSQSILPILQLVAAIFIIAGLIYILGIIAAANNSKPLDPLGVGLTGAGGAVKFLFMTFGTIAAVVVGYILLSNSLRHKAAVDGALLRLPAVGPFLMSLTLARFALALRLTLDSGMRVGQALTLALRGTGNAAFANQAKPVRDSLKGGDDLTLALTRTRLFPDDFLHILAMAEQGGRVPEVMRQQAEQYEEDAERRLAVLTRLASFGIWLFVATLIIIAIFRLYATIYMPYLNQLSS